MELLFDLDGTLTDPASGITRCLEHALRSLGRQVPSSDALRRYIGSPLRETFGELLATADPCAIDAAVRHYRDRFGTVGLYENALYCDVPDGLTELRGLQHRLWVVTSKPRVYAERIVEHFRLKEFFQDIYGSELSGERVVKGDLIAHVLKEERLSPPKVWMIGDRSYDIIGGRTNGTLTMGVLWGYGSREELREARPDVLAESMSVLVDHLLSSTSTG
jgi:phosphoglycolate phosphatase